MKNLFLFMFCLTQILATYYLGNSFLVSSFLAFIMLVSLEKSSLFGFLKNVYFIIALILFYYCIACLNFTLNPLDVSFVANTNKTTSVKTNIVAVIYFGYAVYKYKFNFFISNISLFIAHFNKKLAFNIYLDSKLVINNLYRLRVVYTAQTRYLKSLGKSRLKLKLIEKQFLTLLIYMFQTQDEQEKYLISQNFNEDTLILPTKVVNTDKLSNYIIVAICQGIIYYIVQKSNIIN